MTMNDGVAARPTQAELTELQLQALDAWNRARRAAESAVETTALTREMRLDLSRRVEARRREHQAVLACAAEQLRSSGSLLVRVDPRVVIAHRNPWLREKVAARLTAAGVVVVGIYEDGADAVGAVVVEQPELVLVEDRLPTLSGIEVIRRVRSFSPRTVIGAQVLEGDSVQVLVDAGAQAVFTRRVPPADIADMMVDCLNGDREPVAVG